MKINFEEQFMPAILERGYTYFTEERVQDILIEENTYSATVLGNESYHTSITLENDMVVSMDCDCPFACEHGNCKHMAALCYTIESSSFWIKHDEQKEKIKKLIDSLEKDEMRMLLYKLCMMEDNYRMVKSMQIKQDTDDLLQQQIDDLLLHLENPLDYLRTIKYFHKAETILKNIQQLSTADQFPYLLSLMDMENLNENETFYDLYLEIREMFYDGIYAEEKIYMDWFWEQMSHPSQCDDEVWDIFYELYDTDTAIILLKDMLSTCENKKDKKVLQEAIDSCTK